MMPWARKLGAVTAGDVADVGIEVRIGMIDDEGGSSPATGRQTPVAVAGTAVVNPVGLPTAYHGGPREKAT